MITFHHIHKHYPMDGHTVFALNDLSLELPQKGFVFIVGPSGCGKTTLLNLMGGLDHPTSGQLIVDGMDTKDYSDEQWNTYRNRRVGFVFQSFYLIPHLTILENVMLPIKLAGLSEDVQREKASELLVKLGLSEYLSHQPNQLSGGQQQRAAIARALVMEPDLILADEPTGSLDHQSTDDIMHLLQEISQERLVVMVTHHQKLADIYHDRLVEMEDGKIVADHLRSDIQDVNHHPIEHVQKRTKMSWRTSFQLSYRNLFKRFYRTLLMVLASGLGIMGITLVLGVASGFDRYLELRKTETLNAFPIRVEKVSVVIPFFDEKYQPNLPVFSDVDVAYPRNIQYEFQTVNTLTEDYYEHVKGMDPSTYDHIHYDFGIEQQFAVINDGNIVDPLHTIQELDVNRTYIETNFDLLHGRLPSDDDMEAIIIVDRYNRLSKDVAQSIGFSGDSPINFDDLTALSLRWIPNDVIYSWNGSNYTKQAIDDLIDHDDVLPITIVGVFRIKEKFNLDYLRTGVYYMEHVGALMRENAESSSIVQAQLIQQTSVIDGSPLSTLQHENLLRDLGYATYPTSYTIYSSSFEQKDAIMRYLRSYNDAVSINDAIEPLDIAGIGLSTMRIAIESTTVILLVFSFLSLVISNLMIGIMTYTSVIERTKEIGILRAIGARKQDVGHIFYAETCVIGFFSGLFGVLLGYVLMPVINMILAGLTTIPNVSYLHPIWGLSLIILSILFTSLSGIIPARIASNKDPMLCLRNE